MTAFRFVVSLQRQTITQLRLYRIDTHSLCMGIIIALVHGTWEATSNEILFDTRVFRFAC